MAPGGDQLILNAIAACFAATAGSSLSRSTGRVNRRLQATKRGGREIIAPVTPQPPMPRADVLAAFAVEPFDVFIVGGGIVGAGIARDAAMRGLRVGLVEQGDFASGTSSRSSRLLHGGLRYLAQGRIGLVHEAGRERRTIARIAPHLAMPLPFVFPARRDAPWSLRKLRIGVAAYDLITGNRGEFKSRRLDPRQTLAFVPGLDASQLSGAVQYFDSLTNDARLVIDTLRSAARNGALLANYVRFVDAHRANNIWRVRLEDRLARRELEVSARTVVNAAGPWAEKLPHSGVHLRLTKGCHLVISHARLPIAAAVVMTEGKRILFAIPWGKRVILGTTDTDYAGPPGEVHTEPDDIDYILGVVNGHFPGARLMAADVLADWAGLRPLVAHDGDAGPSDVSRAHIIRLGDEGWMDVAGGKLTTYRLMAQQAVNRLVKYLDVDVPSCGTADEPLLDASAVEGFSGILPPPVSCEAVQHYCTHEWAIRPADIMIRRAGWRFSTADVAGVERQVAEWMMGSTFAQA